MRKIFVIFTLIFALVLSNFTMVEAAKSSDVVVKLNNRAISDVNKVWIIKFKGNVDFSSVKDNISIKDLSGTVLKVDIFPGSDFNLVNILPPRGGYKMNHTYKISINKNLKSSKGQLLNKDITMNFKVSNDPSDYPTTGGNTDTGNTSGGTDIGGNTNTGNTSGGTNTGGNTSTGTDTYKIHAKITVSPILSMFKQVTIDSTTVLSGTKFRFDNSSKIYNVKDTALILANGDTEKAYILDDNLSVLGTFTLNVSSSNNDMFIEADK